jgi:hypothetical protein
MLRGGGWRGAAAAAGRGRAAAAAGRGRDGGAAAVGGARRAAGICGAGFLGVRQLVCAPLRVEVDDQKFARYQQYQLRFERQPT